jgi:hypothetical protein
MKKLIITLILLVPFKCFSGGFYPVGKTVSIPEGFRLYEFESECTLAENYKCFDVDRCSLDICELVDNIVLDYIAKSNEIICTDELDCDAKFIELSCSLDEEKIKNYDLLSVYCAKPIYKIEGKKLQESPQKKAAYKAAKESKRIAKEAKIAQKEANKIELFALKKADLEAMTVSQRNAVIVKLINIVQEIDE